jgi:tetratricopeptide (TPR) repeat protein
MAGKLLPDKNKKTPPQVPTTIKHPDEHDLAVKALVDDMLDARQRDDEQRVLDLGGQLLAMLRPNERTWIALANAELGLVYYEQGNLVVAEMYFEQAVKASPRSEIASLGVFETRGKQHRWRDALSEVLRFVTIRDSPEYRRIFTDEFVSDFSGAELELAQQVQAVLLNKN